MGDEQAFRGEGDGGGWREIARERAELADGLQCFGVAEQGDAGALHDHPVAGGIENEAARFSIIDGKEDALDAQIIEIPANGGVFPATKADPERGRRGEVNLVHRHAVGQCEIRQLPIGGAENAGQHGPCPWVFRIRTECGDGEGQGFFVIAIDEMPGGEVRAGLRQFRRNVAMRDGG